ncbi:DUF5996 family protein [Streptomyces sp. NPDC092296]|uniref:DUF5996 family protein n=1 Tax=Streptomyces sp. NPDC092296 TaxID=3366012 RepID=UPI0038248BFE
MEQYPAFPLADWRPTKETVHRFAQIIGKIRLAASPRRNHWWNVPFHLTGRGITTRPMRDPASGRLFTIDFDFVAHRLVIATLAGDEVSFPLAGRSVADFYRTTLAALAHLGIRTRPALPHPFDLPDSGRPFAEDTEHHTYDTAAVTTYWRILSRVAMELEVFAADYCGKTSPVHHFWHTFDIAVTRFSDRKVDEDASIDPVTREAYSHEVISSGFWFGDDHTPEPAFYSYTAPEPAGLAARPLEPAAARWTQQNGSHLAVLPYAAVRGAPDQHAAVQDFYHSAFRAGADLAGWPAARECNHGVTDPVLV